MQHQQRRALRHPICPSRQGRVQSPESHACTMYALPLAPRSHQSALLALISADARHSRAWHTHDTQPKPQHTAATTDRAQTWRGVQYAVRLSILTHVTPTTAPPPAPDVAQNYALCALSALASLAGAAALALSAIIARTTAATKMSTATAKIMKAAPAS